MDLLLWLLWFIYAIFGTIFLYVPDLDKDLVNFSFFIQIQLFTS